MSKSRGHRDLYRRIRKQERIVSELGRRVKKLYLHIAALTTSIIADILQRYLLTKR